MFLCLVHSESVAFTTLNEKDGGNTHSGRVRGNREDDTFGPFILMLLPDTRRKHGGFLLTHIHASLEPK